MPEPAADSTSTRSSVRGFAYCRPSELLNSWKTRFAAFYCEPGIGGAHEKGGVEGPGRVHRRLDKADVRQAVP
jgi:hypothetical protein